MRPTKLAHEIRLASSGGGRVKQLSPRPLRWPVLPRPPLAGFGVTPEALDADKNWGQTICRRDIGLPRGFMFTGDFAKTIGRWLARQRCRSDDASRRAGEKLQRFWRPTIVISFCARSVSAS